MRLAAIKLDGAEIATIVIEAGLLPIAKINEMIGKNWSNDMLVL